MAFSSCSWLSMASVSRTSMIWKTRQCIGIRNYGINTQKKSPVIFQNSTLLPTWNIPKRQESTIRTNGIVGEVPIVGDKSNTTTSALEYLETNSNISNAGTIFSDMFPVLYTVDLLCGFKDLEGYYLTISEVSCKLTM